MSAGCSMSKCNLVKPSELKSLLQRDGVEMYKWKGFLRGGSIPSFLLESTVDQREVIGKIVALPAEGELKHWPKLRHRNLNPLLGTICLEHGGKIFTAPFVGRCIGHVVREESFIQHPLCFFRKKRYAKGILLGLDYAHHLSTYILNLSDSTVRVCSTSDEAVICDLSCAVQKERIHKTSVPACMPFEPPEVRNDFVKCRPLDSWSCGTLLLQLFTQYLLPRGEVVIDAVQSLDCEVLGKANAGFSLRAEDLRDLKTFLESFLHRNPDGRCSAEQAYKSSFLQVVQSRFDEPARNFWKSHEESAIHYPALCYVDSNESVYSNDSDLTEEVSLRSSPLCNSPCNNRRDAPVPLANRTPSESRTTGSRPPHNRLSVSLTALQHDKSKGLHATLSQYEMRDTDSVYPLSLTEEEEDDLDYELEDTASLSRQTSHAYTGDSFLTEWEVDPSPPVENALNKTIGKSHSSCHSPTSGNPIQRNKNSNTKSQYQLPSEESLSTEEFVKSEKYLLSSQERNDSGSWGSLRKVLDDTKCYPLHTYAKQSHYSLESHKNSVAKSKKSNRKGFVENGSSSEEFYPSSVESEISFSDVWSVTDISEPVHSQVRVSHKGTQCSSSCFGSRACESLNEGTKLQLFAKEKHKNSQNSTGSKLFKVAKLRATHESQNERNGKQIPIFPENNPHCQKGCPTSNDTPQKIKKKNRSTSLEKQSYLAGMGRKNKAKPVADGGSFGSGASSHKNKDRLSGIPEDKVVNDGISSKPATNEDPQSNCSAESCCENESIRSGKESEKGCRWYHRLLCLACKRR